MAASLHTASLTQVHPHFQPQRPGRVRGGGGLRAVCTLPVAGAGQAVWPQRPQCADARAHVSAQGLALSRGPGCDWVVGGALEVKVPACCLPHTSAGGRATLGGCGCAAIQACACGIPHLRLRAGLIRAGEGAGAPTRTHALKRNPVCVLHAAWITVEVPGPSSPQGPSPMHS